LLGTLGGLLVPRWRRKCRPLDVQQRTPVPWATGCALLIRRDCLRDVGGFDEDFFLYYEDVDFCRRAATRGWKICFEPGLEVKHHTPLHSRKPTAALRMMTRHALLTYGVKHWPLWQAALLGSIIWLESGVRQLASRYRGRQHETHIHGQIRRIVGEVLLGRERAARLRIRRTAEQLAATSAALDGV
jgi:N-acetylglucosaminyl-diphospho-decaprenol L-rhamnosyltransferase